MERDLEDLKTRMRQALEDPKKVAEIAVAALRSPYNAYKVVLESMGDRQLAQDWRNTLMLKRDQEKYGVSFSEEITSVFSEPNQEKGREKAMAETINNPNHSLVQAAATAHARIGGFCEQLERGDLILPPRIDHSKKSIELVTARAHSLNTSIFRRFYGTDLFDVCGLVLDTKYPVNHLAESPQSFLSVLEHQETLSFHWNQCKDGFVKELIMYWRAPRLQVTSNQGEWVGSPLIVQVVLPQMTFQYPICYLFVESKLKDEAWFILKTVDEKLISLRKEGIRINETREIWVE